MITTMPTGFWIFDRLGGGSAVIQGGVVVITLSNGGFVEKDGYRYTCETAGGCHVNAQVVGRGTIVETSTSQAQS